MSTLPVAETFTMKVMNRYVALLAAVLWSLPTASSIEAQSVDFATDVYAIFARSCLECHGPDRQEAGLRLDQKNEFIHSGTIVQSEPDASELVRRIELPRNHDEVMPVVGDPLSKTEVATIRRWIESGANWPDDFVPPKHWAYVVPKQPDAPEVSESGWLRQPIDAFVLSKLDAVGLRPSPPADRSVWLRRVHLDLIGLPPTLEEIERFENDDSPDARRRVVDGLLARPQFGEHWARPWLDMARYADSHGFQRDDLRDLWAYRDWVINAINDDMPFDQFTIEQLAGDLIDNSTESQRIATGFHRCAPTNVEAGSLPEETRVQAVLDRVNTTASVWLGSTLECAQCHDHKFDPFSIREYYELFAFFNNTEIEADLTNPDMVSSIAFRGPSMPISNPERDQARQALNARRQPIANQISKRRQTLRSDLVQWSEQLKRNAAVAPKAGVLEIVGFESTGNTDTFRIRDDGAVLLVGTDPPAVDRYTVTAKIDANSFSDEPVRAIRLNVLTDPSLPGTGPGRGDAKRANFVLNEFTVSLIDASGKKQPIDLESGVADFSQNNFDVSGAIDGDPKTGWAINPQFFRPHHAIFALREPLNVDDDVTLEIVMDQQFGGARTIGCFQIVALATNETTEPIPNNILKIVRSDAATWSDKDRDALVDFRAKSDAVIAKLQTKLDEIDDQLRALQPDTTQVMVELPMPRASTIFERGDYKSPGDGVVPATPRVLHRLDPTLPLNRLTLARWLVDPNNPLVARVTVNRWWMELFGEGLVRTPEDFGVKGDRPTHPELLDWLAVEFVESGWSMKHVLRTIVLSSVYAQSSSLTPELLQRDDANEYLARGPRVRMDAETIRDNALAIGGLISYQMSGPPIRPVQPEGLWTKVGGQRYDYIVSPGGQKHRRGVYVVIKRGAPYPSFVNFDAGNRLKCTIERSRSNTPLQALTLLNDPVYVEIAKSMAWRAARRSIHQSVGEVITEEFRRAVARPPSESEQSELMKLWSEQLQRHRDDPSDASRLSQPRAIAADADPAEFAAWYSVATVILNLHETITKE
jgi:mono/diheme cytochrome c family protein